MYREAAGLVAKRGYTNIKCYRDGIPGWAKAGYSLVTDYALPKVNITAIKPELLKDKMDDYYIIDIREVFLLKKLGKIQGSYNEPLAELSANLPVVPAGKIALIADHAGKQAGIAAKYLHSKGITNVAMLQGGILGWLRKGFPLEKVE
jgi:rhodanese-related sulfurtransferase